MTDNCSREREANLQSSVGVWDELMEQAYGRADDLPERLVVRTGGEERLLGHARTCLRPTELVVAPVELHQRNLQRRLREQSLPKDAFEFVDPVALSKRLLTAIDRPKRSIDRIDRLTLLRSALDDPQGLEADLSSNLPGVSSSDPQHIEQLRTEIETVTNFHPDRIQAWKRVADDLQDPIDVETTERLVVGLDVEQALRERTQEEKAVSETELVRRATRSIVETSGSAWTKTYASIERVWLLGLSSLSATHADLLQSLLSETAAEVRIHFREGTGDYLTGRLRSLLEVDRPGREVFE